MKRPKSEALSELYDELIGEDPALQAEHERELIDAQVAQLIYAMRTEAGLSQRDLAKLVRTTASVICRLESAESGHSLAMLVRIASALGRQIEIKTLPKRAA